MFRISSLLLFSTLFNVGCSTTNSNPPVAMAPPPGWTAAPPITAPAPTPGCSSCAGGAPVVNAPRYSPPFPASPPLTSATPGLSIGFPVSTPVAHGPIQAAFTPIGSSIESAKLGIIQVEETPTIPVPPEVAAKE